MHDVSEVYKGYQILSGNTNEINHALENPSSLGLCTNEYLIIRNSDDGSEREMRFDGEKLVTLKLPSSKHIKGKNSLQRCALDMLGNNDIKICAILGTYGSGKTILSLRMALYNVTEKMLQDKILGVRNAVSEGGEIGYLKGDFESKTDWLFLPLAQNLPGGTYELDSLKQRGVLESNIIYFMKGTTYNDTIIVVDEAEDLNERALRLVGTRVGQNGRIFLAGDYQQSVVNSSSENPLVKMCKEFKGNPLFACIYLEDDVRSETSKLFANLFKK